MRGVHAGAGSAPSVARVHRRSRDTSPLALRRDTSTLAAAYAAGERRRISAPPTLVALA